jgi:hypothetical protein
MATEAIGIANLTFHLADISDRRATMSIGATEFMCALDVCARHTLSRITFWALTIVGRSRGDVSSHQDIFQTFRFPESQDGWLFEDFAHIQEKNSSYIAMPTARRKILSTSWNVQFVAFNTWEKLSNNLINA